jgi:hypothetical protein
MISINAEIPNITGTSIIIQFGVPIQLVSISQNSIPENLRQQPYLHLIVGFSPHVSYIKLFDVDIYDFII